MVLLLGFNISLNIMYRSKASIIQAKEVTAVPCWKKRAAHKHTAARKAMNVLIIEVYTYITSLMAGSSHACFDTLTFVTCSCWKMYIRVRNKFTANPYQKYPVHTDIDKQ